MHIGGWYNISMKTGFVLILFSFLALVVDGTVFANEGASTPFAQDADVDWEELKSKIETDRRDIENDSSSEKREEHKKTLAVDLTALAFEMMKSDEPDLVKKSLVLLNESLYYDAQNSETNYLKGLYYYFIEDKYEMAIESLERAVCLDPENSDYHFYLGMACYEMANDVHSRILISKARSEFGEAIKLNPGNAEAKYNYNALSRITTFKEQMLLLMEHVTSLF